ncbi:MAG: single-stranded-DNA-specific exonuclease RecJ, partial [Chloroflexi bacterium]|nr:single-stranded-DNA-specific exonuclease RecJ [Chloroflexota bacterium]
MKGMNEAVDRIRTAIRRAEPIAVYGDFDADGVTATALLVQVLQGLGAKAREYIPHRVDEGYGLNQKALEGLLHQGYRLVISTDCGIRSAPEVAFAQTHGLDVIITDHHSPSDEIPPALTIVNPKQPGCPYPFKGLSGVGVAYKLAQALLLVEGELPALPQRPEKPPCIQDSLDLVALGTV